MRPYISLIVSFSLFVFVSVSQNKLTKNAIEGTFVFKNESGFLSIHFKKNGKYRVKANESLSTHMQHPVKGTWQIKNDTLVCREKESKALFPLMGPMPGNGFVWEFVMEKGELILLENEKRSAIVFHRIQ